MNKVEDHPIDVLASKVNSAGGIIETIDGIVDFEEILNSRQRETDAIVNATKRANEIPENLVAEIDMEMGNKKGEPSALRGQMAAVEKALKERMAKGRNPSHAVIGDDGIKITDREDEQEL